MKLQEALEYFHTDISSKVNYCKEANKFINGIVQKDILRHDRVDSLGRIKSGLYLLTPASVKDSDMLNSMYEKDLSAKSVDDIYELFRYTSSTANINVYKLEEVKS